MAIVGRAPAAAGAGPRRPCRPPVDRRRRRRGDTAEVVHRHPTARRRASPVVTFSPRPNITGTGRSRRPADPACRTPARRGSRTGWRTIRPNSSVRPRSACRASMATSGPGCGGTSPCSTDRPASAGMPTRSTGSVGARGRRAARSGRAGRRRPRRTAGCRSARRPRAIAHGSRARTPGRRWVDDRGRRPPESASSPPIIAPSAISTPDAADGRAQPGR